jgi:hypothetical protein
MKHAAELHTAVKPRPSKLKFKGNEISLEEFCKVLNEIVRTGLVKAIDYTERKLTSAFKPDWDAMILDE